MKKTVRDRKPTKNGKTAKKTAGVDIVQTQNHRKHSIFSQPRNSNAREANYPKIWPTFKVWCVILLACLHVLSYMPINQRDFVPTYSWLVDYFCCFHTYSGKAKGNISCNLSFVTIGIWTEPRRFISGPDQWTVYPYAATHVINPQRTALAPHSSAWGLDFIFLHNMCFIPDSSSSTLIEVILIWS